MTKSLRGKMISKSDPLMESYGCIDELNCAIGIVLSEISTAFKSSMSKRQRELIRILNRIQRELLEVGYDLEVLVPIISKVST